MKKKFLFYLFLCVLLMSVPLIPAKLLKQDAVSEEPEALTDSTEIASRQAGNAIMF